MLHNNQTSLAFTAIAYPAFQKLCAETLSSANAPFVMPQWALVPPRLYFSQVGDNTFNQTALQPPTKL